MKLSIRRYVSEEENRDPEEYFKIVSHHFFGKKLLYQLDFGMDSNNSLDHEVVVFTLVDAYTIAKKLTKYDNFKYIMTKNPDFREDIFIDNILETHSIHLI